MRKFNYRPNFSLESSEMKEIGFPKSVFSQFGSTLTEKKRIFTLEIYFGSIVSESGISNMPNCFFFVCVGFHFKVFVLEFLDFIKQSGSSLRISHWHLPSVERKNESDENEKLQHS